MEQLLLHLLLEAIKHILAHMLAVHLGLVHNADAQLSIKAMSKVPFDAGIRLCSIPDAQLSQYCESVSYSHT